MIGMAEKKNSNVNEFLGQRLLSTTFYHRIEIIIKSLRVL